MAYLLVFLKLQAPEDRAWMGISYYYVPKA